MTFAVGQSRRTRLVRKEGGEPSNSELQEKKGGEETNGYRCSFASVQEKGGMQTTAKWGEIPTIPILVHSRSVVMGGDGRFCLNNLEDGEEPPLRFEDGRGGVRCSSIQKHFFSNKRVVPIEFTLKVGRGKRGLYYLLHREEKKKRENRVRGGERYAIVLRRMKGKTLRHLVQLKSSYLH